MSKARTTKIEGGPVPSLANQGTRPAKEVSTPERIRPAGAIAVMLDTIGLCIDLLNKEGNDSGVALLKKLRERVEQEAV